MILLDPLEWALAWWRQSRRDPVELAELEETHLPVQAAGRRVLGAGRSVHLAVDQDGHLHLRRRARQIRRAYGSGVTWRAMPRAWRDPALPSRWRQQWPWWCSMKWGRRG